MPKKTEQQNKSDSSKLVIAHARSLHIAPRKLRLVANMVKRMRVQDALVHLQFTNKKGADIVIKLLKSAIANAEHNFSYSSDGLFIQGITCDGAQVMKRYMPRARGSSSPLNRRMSHLHIALEFKESAVSKTGRFARLAAKSKPAEFDKPEEPSVPLAKDTEARRKDAPKTAEQIKQNKVQQKRRLFNRKSGV